MIVNHLLTHLDSFIFGSLKVSLNVSISVKIFTHVPILEISDLPAIFNNDDIWGEEELVFHKFDLLSTLSTLCPF